MTTRAYIVVFASSYATREQVQACLDSINEVTFWYACLPQCVFFTSNLSAVELSSRFDAYFRSQNRRIYCIIEINQNRQGWLPRDAWYLMANPSNPRQNNTGDKS